ncbi:MAG TPA: hypothetical protein RMH85_31330 [Polyangiaceae bacterium LLY-WYZ-15_(1-7)]|nr:hypothetical protein [Sandaracinus sp.]HJL05167.1 hypothetical protein [Polyangiaceae bacterium LLY-WYZ-15_(1-7)]MBJ71815.1 hypothetical protein [Sandaracinus sp.]HJL13018.1 hypothetical protein [Polyangiaceae bacterium LLY-WYZ-15_(1-7)]HJL23118.1 hypothetical protein [Polyangiaceae bacterium LLY-WYZ-15_(1-7)]
MRRALPFLGALALVVGAWLAWDALVVDERERVAAVADAFAGEIRTDRVDAALQHVDVDVAPLEVDVRGRTRVYGRGAAGDLRRDALRGLGAHMGQTLRVLSRSIELDEDAATVAQRLMGDRGMVQVELRLEHHEQRWLVRRLRVHR